MTMILAHENRAYCRRRRRSTGSTLLQYSCSAQLAKAEKVNDSYLSRILRLTLIAPDVTEAILAGRQPSTFQLDDLLEPLPSAWPQQHSIPPIMRHLAG